MAAPATSAAMAPADLVGYGKYGELTYQQLWDQEPVYCLWTVNKFEELVKEGDELATPYVVGESKMKRLTQWIKHTDDLRAAVEPEFECDSDMEMVEIEKPETETLEKRCAKLREAQTSKFYGVARPEEHAGVYSSWAECKPHVFGIKGVMYKSFATEEDAQEYVQNPPAKKGETPEEIAAREQARIAKEEAKAVKVAEAQAARAAKETEKAAKAAETKAVKEQAKAAKEQAKAGKRTSGSGKKREADGETPADKRQKTEAAAAVEIKPVAKGNAKAAAKETKATKGGASSSTPSEAILSRAKDLGMSSALSNLTSRPEIISMGLSAETLLDALVKADGLVNKAKAALLSAGGATSDPTSPSQDVRMDRLNLPISPEKHEQEKQEKNGDDALAKTLKSLSSTLMAVSARLDLNVQTQPDLTDVQAQRIKENRERALARKAQIAK